MPIRIRCRCGKALVASRRQAGKIARCPQCKQRIRIPSTPAPRSAPRPPAGTATESVATAQTTAAGTTTRQPKPSHSSAPDRPQSTRGVEHDPGKRLAVGWLAVVFGITAVVGSAPAVWHLAGQIQNAGGPQLENWNTILLLLSAIQLAYAIYLFHLPDWSSVRVVSIVAMLSAAPYAGLLGIGLRARPQNPIVQWLGLSPQLIGGQALGWSLLMICLTGTTALIAGRLASHWYRIPHTLSKTVPPASDAVRPASDTVRLSPDSPRSS
ncbi:MAG: hypothetical protein CMJ59_06020 [Planctomycetaceae bacterium]|nr:hypothetical protein [Planctomycetaceae bacterium]